MAGERAEFATAAPFDFKQAVFGDGFHGEADFVHVGDDEDAWSFCICAVGAEMRIRLPASSVSGLAQGGSKRSTDARTGAS